MVIHVHRESGLAHRTMTFQPWQVQALRVLTSKWFLIALSVGLFSWGYFAIQAVRVPFLTQRIAHMEQDARRMDTLQFRLTQLQARYDQVQRMLSGPSVKGQNTENTTKSTRTERSGAAKPD